MTEWERFSHVAADAPLPGHFERLSPMPTSTYWAGFIPLFASAVLYGCGAAPMRVEFERDGASKTLL